MPQLELANHPFGIERLEQVTDGLVLDRLRDHVESCGPIFPSYESSLQLIEAIRGTGLIRKMIDVEKQGQHTPLSHAIMVTEYAASVSRQINTMFGRILGSYIIDEPLTITAAFFHDIGNLIGSEEINSYQLNGVDISLFTQSYPHDSPWTDIPNNHILRSIALLSHFGFLQHAEIVAHSPYHLLDDQSHNTIERLILILADFSVDEKKEGAFPYAYFVPSLFERMDKAYFKHRGDIDIYKKQFLFLQAVRSLLYEAGVVPPGEIEPEMSLPEETIQRRLAAILKFLKLFGIERQENITGVKFHLDGKN